MRVYLAVPGVAAVTAVWCLCISVASASPPPPTHESNARIEAAGAAESASRINSEKAGKGKQPRMPVILTPARRRDRQSDRLSSLT